MTKVERILEQCVAAGERVGDLSEAANNQSAPIGTFRLSADNRLPLKEMPSSSRPGPPYLMLARYYSSSLGRFMAVDPGDDTALEDPQSWNKYAYTRNNPLKYVDKSGEDITLAGDRQRSVERLLVRTVQKPSARARFEKIAGNKDFNLTIKDARLPEGNFERLDPNKAKDTNADGKIDQAVLEIDTYQVLEQHPTDKSGVETMAHGLHHGEALSDTGDWSVGLAGDQPTSETGPANAAGEQAAKENSDKTKKQAKEIVKTNVKKQKK